MLTPWQRERVNRYFRITNRQNDSYSWGYTDGWENQPPRYHVNEYMMGYHDGVGDREYIIDTHEQEFLAQLSNDLPHYVALELSLKVLKTLE